MCEDQMIQRLKKRDEAAFREFQSRYRQDIYRVAYGVVQNYEDALDICQEVLLKVSQRIDQYHPQPGKPLSAWLRTVTKNEALNFLRGENRRFNRLQRDDKMGDEMENIPHPQSNPSSEAERRELGEIIMAVMKTRLTERERHFFELKHKAGLTYKEITEQEDCAVGTVKATVARAVQKMVDGLAQRGIDSADYVGGK